MTLSDLVRPVRARIASQLHPCTAERRVRDVCEQYRRAIRGASVACPAEILLTPGIAEWVRKHGIRVDARSSAELALAFSVGAEPVRIVMHGDGGTAGPLRCAVNAGVGQFVVGSGPQVAVLAQWARRPLRVLIDVTSQAADDLRTKALGSDRIEVIGLHRRVDDSDRYAEVVVGMVQEMAQMRWDRGVLATRLSLATTIGACPRGMSEAVEDALDEACARFRFPRPTVAVSLRGPVLGS